MLKYWWVPAHRGLFYVRSMCVTVVWPPRVVVKDDNAGFTMLLKALKWLCGWVCKKTSGFL